MQAPGRKDRVGWAGTLPLLAPAATTSWSLAPRFMVVLSLLLYYRLPPAACRLLLLLLLLQGLQLALNV